MLTVNQVGTEATTRRAFLRSTAKNSLVLPGAYLLLTGQGERQTARAETGMPLRDTETGNRLAKTGSSDPATLVRNFADPYLEMLRLLREAAEVEHALMVQYLYAAFSVKPPYQALAGFGDPNAHDLIGVAVQEMQHLGAVNRLLAELGAAPQLERQDFPYEPDIYPFAFDLEPLSRTSLAKYVYAEAPEDALRMDRARSEADVVFLHDLNAALGGNVRMNHVGSLYGTIIELLRELPKSKALARWPDLDAWTEKLERIKDEGEADHYEFFKSLFLAQHDGFGSVSQIWNLSVDDPAYPSYTLPANPSGFVGHDNQILDPTTLALAQLSNLHYWTVLCLLDVSYRDPERADEVLQLARAHMLGPLQVLARHLPTRGAGVPFDPLSMGYSPGRTPQDTLRIVRQMIGEADHLAHLLSINLPTDYPLDVHSETLATLNSQIHASAGGEATLFR
jgi:rubrerythrin